MNTAEYEPLANYSEFYENEHARNVANHYEKIIRKSAIDVELNKKTVASIEVLLGRIKHITSKKKQRSLFVLILLLPLTLGALYFGVNRSLYYCGVAISCSGFLLYLYMKYSGRATSQIAEIDAALKEKYRLAWEQMAPLNRLFSREDALLLVQKTFPNIEFDKFVSNERLKHFYEVYDCELNLDKNQSAISAYAASLNGNSILIYRIIEHWMGACSYDGSLNIKWFEYSNDSEGRPVRFERQQTLHASITKSFPEYRHRTLIMFGSNASPDLSFSRSPVHSVKSDDSGVVRFFKNKRHDAFIKNAKKISGERRFALMANHEFDAKFAASNRDNESQFRVLFTPLAQQEVLKIINDFQIGFGDNFHYVKNRMLNTIESEHLAALNISPSPEIFHSYDLTKSQFEFNQFHKYYFKSIYFALAPILAIPIFRTHLPIREFFSSNEKLTPSSVEHESIANEFDAALLRPLDCDTSIIIKTNSKKIKNNIQLIDLISTGYRKSSAVSHVSVRGGDGEFHSVPINYIEYIEVSKHSVMLIQDVFDSSVCTDSASNLKRCATDLGYVCISFVSRKSVIATLLSRE